MEKKALLAIAISFLFLGIYPYILEKFYPEAAKVKPKPAVSATVPADTPSKPESTLPVSRAALTDQDDFRYQNEQFRLSFAAVGGGVRELSFPKFQDPVTKEAIRFFKFDEASQTSGAVLIDGAAFKGSVEQRFADEIAYTAKTDTGLLIKKSQRFRSGRYGSDVNLRIQNDSGVEQSFQYELVVGADVPPRHSIDSQFVESNFYYSANGKFEIQHLREAKSGKSISSPGPVKWAATKDRHFSGIWAPKGEGLFTARHDGLGNHHYRVVLVSPKIVLRPGESVTQEFLAYFGPNDVRELAPFGLDAIVNFGKLDWIAKLLIGGLELTVGLFKNYGIAIILLTLLTNVVLFPFTRVSYMSMKRMQLIQPQMSKLRDQHKKSPEKLNREMMELYKKHKVNPFGGCLPMLMQMPIFVSLYIALSKTVALVGAQFLWVQDLSSPDNLPLPFSLPFLGNSIHVLPLLMMAAMFFQQKFTQVSVQGQDPATASQQKMMGIMMPLLFGFIFYTMPSGLVLYWFTNTIFMTAYQWRLKHVTL